MPKSKIFIPKSSSSSKKRITKPKRSPSGPSPKTPATPVATFSKASGKPSARPKGAERVATLVIEGAGRLNPKQRKDVVAWLMKQAQTLENEWKNLTDGKYTAGFNYIH